MVAQADTAVPAKAPTQNKAAASLGGGVAGGGAGALVVWLLDAHYGIALSPELASIVGGAASSVAAAIGAFFMPLVTAAQQAALRKLEQ